MNRGLTWIVLTHQRFRGPSRHRFWLGNGDFSIFVAVSQTGTQTVRVNPKDFYGLYSDHGASRVTAHPICRSCKHAANGLEQLEQGRPRLYLHRWTAEAVFR